MKIWVLLLITALINGAYNIKQINSYDHLHTCRLAVEAHSTFIYNEHHKAYVCVARPKLDKKITN